MCLDQLLSRIIIKYLLMIKSFPDKVMDLLMVSSKNSDK